MGLAQQALQILMVGASAQMLFYVPREPRLFREGVEVTTQGSFTQSTAAFTTAYLVEHDLRTGDIIAITSDGRTTPPSFSGWTRS